MERFLYRVQYSYPDETSSYELVCVRAADDDLVSARAEVDEATQRHARFTKSSKTLTLLLVTADV